MTEFDALTLTAFAAILLLGGLAKGVLGVGLPMITVPLLSTFILVPEAVALMYVPVLVTNIWQAFQGGYFRTALGRFWPIFPLWSAKACEWCARPAWGAAIARRWSRSATVILITPTSMGLSPPCRTTTMSR